MKKVLNPTELSLQAYRFGQKITPHQMVLVGREIIEPSAIYTTAEVAGLLRVHPKTVNRLIEGGEIVTNLRSRVLGRFVLTYLEGQA